MNLLQKVIIEKCIEIYSAVADDVLVWWEETLPKELIIIESKKRNECYNSIKSYQMCWRIFEERIEPCSFDENIYFQLGQNVYRSVLFTFYISADEKNVFIEYYVAPRFARGFQYDIITGDNGVSLEREKQVWVS